MNRQLVDLNKGGALTLTHYACIFSMDTVVFSETWMLTILNEGLISFAHDIIHPDRTTARSKPEVMNGLFLLAKVSSYSLCYTEYYLSVKLPF